MCHSRTSRVEFGQNQGTYEDWASNDSQPELRDTEKKMPKNSIPNRNFFTVTRFYEKIPPAPLELHQAENAFAKPASLLPWQSKQTSLLALQQLV